MASSPILKTKRGQTVRLPKSVAFPDGVLSIDILKIGEARILVPQGRRWDDLFDGSQRLSEDFTTELGAGSTATVRNGSASHSRQPIPTRSTDRSRRRGSAEPSRR
jgi:antitoxin VapB